MTTIRARFGTARRSKARKPSPRPVSRAACQLALAHYVERLIDEGKLADYATAARALGLTRARLTQIMKLLLLAPEVQERVFLGEVQDSERGLRRAVAEAEWGRQASPCYNPGAALGRQRT